MSLRTLKAVVLIKAVALAGANQAMAEGDVIKAKIAKAEAELAIYRAELNEVFPPIYNDRFGENLGTIASGIAGPKKPNDVPF